MRKPSEVIINGKTLEEILENHNHYLRRDVKGLVSMRANLRDADLSDADIRYADLRYAKNILYIPLECPSDGAFIGWKKINKILIKLEIPEDARRSSATTKKCRCDKAKVLGFYNALGTEELDMTELVNDKYEKCKYVKSEMVYPDSFDENRWNECSHGIHFFVNKQDAINYNN